MSPYVVAWKILSSRQARQAVMAIALVAGGIVVIAVAAAAALFSNVFGDTIEGVPSSSLPVGMPEFAYEFWPMYHDAAAVYEVSPFLLMAVHGDESDFSHSRAPGVTTGKNFAHCCAGPMQFLIASGESPFVGGIGGTWFAHVRVSLGGEPAVSIRLADAYKNAKIERPPAYTGRVVAPHPNVYDSFDSIYAAAAYFKSLGVGPKLDERTFEALIRYKGTPPASIPFAQDDYDRAREFARIYEANGGTLASKAPSGSIVKANRPDSYLESNGNGPDFDEWLAPVPGFPGERCDRRIMANLLYLIETYRLTLTDCYSIGGAHRTSGEHPLGLAADLVPAPNGSWNLVAELAAWAEPQQNHPRSPFRWVGYNGDADHGDPQHAPNSAHIHLSWSHAESRWNFPAQWVTVWR
jgi:hypothetical protein